MTFRKNLEKYKTDLIVKSKKIMELRVCWNLCIRGKYRPFKFLVFILPCTDNDESKQYNSTPAKYNYVHRKLKHHLVTRLNRLYIIYSHIDSDIMEESSEKTLRNLYCLFPYIHDYTCNCELLSFFHTHIHICMYIRF